jgi:hypothetical protein
MKTARIALFFGLTRGHPRSRMSRF